MATQPTQNPVPSESPRDLKFNAGKIDEFVTSDSHEYVDRFGGKHRTIAGINYDANQAILNYGYITKDSFEDGSTLSTANECLRWKSNGEYYRWDGNFPKVVPPGSTPDSTGGVQKGAWVGVGDASLRSDMKKEEGAGLSGYQPGMDYPYGSVGAYLNAAYAMLPTVNIANYASLKEAIAAIPSGGTVYVPVGKFRSGHWNTSETGNMSTDNIRILGEKMPMWDTALRKLTGGSVIQDRFICFANNLSVENIGFDTGKDYIDATYPGIDTTKSTHPDGGTWDAFVFGAPAANVAQKRNLYMRNVVGLMYNSQAIGHAVLTEGYTGGRLDNIIGIYGYHGAIVKGCDVFATAIYTYGQSANGLIVKADQFSNCGNVWVEHYHARKPKGTTPWSDPAYVTNAVSVDPNAVAFNGPISIFTKASAPVNHVNLQGLQPLTGVNLKMVTDGLADNGAIVTEYPLIAPGANLINRIEVESMQVTNCNHIVYMAQPSANPSNQLHIKSIQAANITNAGLYALDNAEITVDYLEVDVIKSLYFMTALGKIWVGKAKPKRMTGPTFMSDGGGVSPSLAPGWVQAGDNEKYEFYLQDYKACVKGFLQATTGATANVIVIPTPLKPKSPPRLPVMMITTAPTIHWVSVVDDVDGVTGRLRTGDGALPASTNYLSLSGVSWDY
ncbi:hypothetical protein [Enterobacter sp.]|uniref:tail fiber/spike domain-containing protein n=1 Tax=Enterobacter sp. TaxID=42895 RepID=UPI00296E42B6|nr:hypothetical protein [Enterobacter sp.]